MYLHDSDIPVIVHKFPGLQHLNITPASRPFNILPLKDLSLKSWGPKFCAEAALHFFCQPDVLSSPLSRSLQVLDLSQEWPYTRHGAELGFFTTALLNLGASFR